MSEAGPTPAPKRRWFAFSLRTFLVVFALGSILLGWTSYQLSWIRQRQQVLLRDGKDLYAYPIAYWEAPDAPWPIHCFGEMGYAEILLVHTDSTRARIAGSHFGSEKIAETLLEPDERAELDHVRRLFPEAYVCVDFAPDR